MECRKKEDPRVIVSAVVNQWYEMVKRRSAEEFAARHGAVSALRALTSYDWPGNIRELKNVVERAVILSRDEPEIRPEQFSQCLPAMRPDSVVLSFDHPPTMDEIEHQYLNLLLKRYQGHRQSVATTMGVSPRNIYRLVQKHGFKH